MNKRLMRLIKWLLHSPNFGVSAPRIFTEFEVKLLCALSTLGVALLWELAQNDMLQGVWGLSLITGLLIYLSYNKYYCTYKPAMDRWAIRELANKKHPRQEYRVANRDLLISADEVKLIAKQHEVKIVCHEAPENPVVLIYELERSYQHRLQANHFATEREYPSNRKRVSK